MKRIGDKLKIEIKDQDIALIYCLPFRANNPPIVAKLNNCDIKTNLIQTAKKAKFNGKCMGLNPRTPQSENTLPQ